MLKVRDHCHVIRKYRRSAYRDSNIKVKLNKTPAVFHNTKKYDSYLIMQELGKFNCNINVIQNKFENT